MLRRFNAKKTLSLFCHALLLSSLCGTILGWNARLRRVTRKTSNLSQGRFFLGSTCVALEFKILIQQPRHVCKYVGGSFLPGMAIYDGKGVSSILLLLCRCVQTWGKKYKFPPSTAQFPQKKQQTPPKGFFQKWTSPPLIIWPPQ